MREISISGYCYPPNSSDRKPALLNVYDHDSYELVIDTAVVKSGNLHDLKFSDRIGSINRKIFFDSGTQFETPDNETIDQLLVITNHKSGSSGTVNKLESSWTFAIASIVCTILLVIGFFKFGLPAAARYAAYQIPVSTSEKLSEGTLEILDRVVFKDSETSETEKLAITDRFNRHLENLPDTGGFNYTLHFRSMRGVANAFALPGGEVVITDTLIKIATEEELDSVIFHEIGHVVQRHGLQGVIKGSTVAVLVSIALGDLSAVGELTTGVGTLFLQGSYTRAAETEADDYALLHMENQGIDPIHFARVMQKLSSQGGGNGGGKDGNSEDGTESSKEKQKEYLSTHPSSLSRIRKAQERSRVFNSQ